MLTKEYTLKKMTAVKTNLNDIFLSMGHKLEKQRIDGITYKTFLRAKSYNQT
jgi:hypothetical protein